MGFFDWLRGSEVSQPPTANLATIHLTGDDDFSFPVVGESHYQDTLNAICGGKCEDGHELEIKVQLCFHDNNPHDPNAIVVLVDRTAVGYIPRDLAPKMRSEILRLNPDEQPVTCDAVIVGGWLRDSGDEGSYGVRLNISDPMAAVRVNVAG